VSQVEADQIKAGQAAQQQKESQDQEELMKASVRKILAESLKNLSQASKNDAAAATTVFSTLLKGLEAGVTPNEVAAAGGAQNYVPVSPGTGVDSNEAVATAPNGQNSGGADLGQFLG
jgi:vancomycin resistance protein YoaR